MSALTVQQALEIALEQLKSGQVSEAAGILQQVVAVAPDDPDALHMSGVAAHLAGNPAAAVTWFAKAVAIRPDSAEFRNNYGLALHSVGSLQAAVAEFRAALRLAPDLTEAHNNYGSTLNDLGDQEAAAAVYHAAIARWPLFAKAHYNLGCLQRQLRDHDAAIASFHTALEIQPAYPAALTNLANSLKDQGDIAVAIACYRRALEFEPSNVGFHSNLVYTTLFDPQRDYLALREDQAAWARCHAAPLVPFIQPHRNARVPERRLRVGYVSPDFCAHVISHFLIPLLEAHDHAAFEIHCYASVKRPDIITGRLHKASDKWHDVLALSDEQLAAQIRADEIDILVDLTQHMAANRLLLFARKPAPVQVAWLGFPGSTGLQTIDYRFTDAKMEPLGATWAESVEEAIRLPDSWFCFDPLTEYPVPGKLPALAQGRVTFGCLNTFSKVHVGVLALWAKVLLAIPGSRLLLQCPAGSTQQRVREIFSARGITPDRLELVGRIADRDAFLMLFERIDIALDPFPYNGGTTTCEALWMGLPVLTLPGTQIVSRIGLSILSAVGLPELVADSDDDFVRRSVALAGDLSRLAELRATLRDRMQASPFMDGPRFARAVESAYRTMWKTWCAAQH